MTQGGLVVFCYCLTFLFSFSAASTLPISISCFISGGVLKFNSLNGLLNHHQRQRHRRHIRKRLRFPSETEDEPDVRRRKVDTDTAAPPGHQDDTSRETPETPTSETSREEKVANEDVPDSEVTAVQSITKVLGSSPETTREEKHDCEDFPMPDLSSDIQFGQIPVRGTPHSNQATPDPPVLHRIDALPNIHGSPDVNDNGSSSMPAVATQVHGENKSELLQLLSSEPDSLKDTPPSHIMRAIAVKENTGNNSTVSEDNDANPNESDGDFRSKIAPVERNDLNVPLGEARHVGLLSSSKPLIGVQNKDNDTENETPQEMKVMEPTVESDNPNESDGDFRSEIASVERNDLNVPLGEARHVGLHSSSKPGIGVQNKDNDTENETPQERETVEQEERDSAASVPRFTTIKEEPSEEDIENNDEPEGQCNNDRNRDHVEPTAEAESFCDSPKGVYNSLPRDMESDYATIPTENFTSIEVREIKGQNTNASQDICSPTITPRDTYEMFAAPTSNGKFNGRGPLGNGSICSIDEANVEVRKMKLDQVLKSQPSCGTNVEVAEVELDWCKKIKKSRRMRMYAKNKDGVDEDWVLEENVSSGEGVSEEHPALPSNAWTVAQGEESNAGHYLASGLHNQWSGVSEMRYGIAEGVARRCSYKQDTTARHECSRVNQHNFDDSAESPTGHEYERSTVTGAASLVYPDVADKQFCYDQYDATMQESEADCNGLTQYGFHQKNSDYQYMLESSRSFLKANGSGDACVVDDYPRPSHELLADIHDALKLILGDAYNPCVDDPVEALAICGTELLKNDATRFDFIAFCEYLLQ